MKPSFRKSAFASLLLIVTLSWSQPAINFDDGSYQSVLQRSKDEHKNIFYMLYANWCSHCNKMKQDVFKEEKVSQYLNANFVCAWQDVEKGQGAVMKQQFKANAYPTFLVLDANGQLLYAFNGEWQADDFLAEIKLAQVPEKQLPYLEKQFRNDPSNGKKCLEYLATLKKSLERSQINAQAQQYFATQSDAQMLSEINWRIIANGVSDIESRPFQYVLQHKAEFEKIASPKRVQKKLDNIVSESLNPYVESLDTVNYFKKRSMAKSLNTTRTDSIIYRYDLQISQKKNDWKWYAKINRELAQKYAWNDANLLKDIAMAYTKNIVDIEDLVFAVKLLDRSLEKNDSYDGAIAMAKLYRKINDKKQALAYAERARKRNADLGFNTKEADEIILQLTQK